jgi:hypothetical protein
MLMAVIPILLELFTSQGCSSCPPADALLQRLHETQPIEGAQLVVISEHVDYWNNLGWRDPFSSSQFSERQGSYPGFRTYTPQAMVDGRVDAVGSDRASIETAVKGALSDPHGIITLDRSDPAFVKIRIEQLPKDHGAADVVVAFVEDGLSVQVEHGENKGLTLKHVAVARSLETVAAVDGAAWSGEVKPRGTLRAVVFVQERKSRHVLATAMK